MGIRPALAAAAAVATVVALAAAPASAATARTIALTASPTGLNPGATGTLTVSMKGGDGSKFAIEQLSGSTWKTVASSTWAAGSSGFTWSYTATGRGWLTYRAVASATKTKPRVMSKTVQVGVYVKPTVQVTASSTTPAAGDQLTFTGTVSPYVRGTKISVVRDNARTPVATTTVRTDGTYSVAVTVLGGRAGYRILVARAHSAFIAAGSSAAVEITGAQRQWTQVSAGAIHACATKSGQLWCWGDNEQGQSALSFKDPYALRPTRVGTATDYKSVAAGDDSTCAISGSGSKAGGTLWCWGHNDVGQLGVGYIGSAPKSARARTSGFTWDSSKSVNVPTKVGAGSAWTAASVGTDHACGLSAGQLWCWGSNKHGQLGQAASVARSSKPMRVGTGSDWASVSAGSDYTCAVKSGGTLWCWGTHVDGVTGLGGSADVLTPTQVGTATTWKTVAAGTGHTCGLQTTGTAWCWGANAHGEVGNGSTTSAAAPVQVTAATDWTAIATGVFGSCGVRSGGQLWCWGTYPGLGTSDPTTLPSRVGTGDGWSAVTMSGADVFAGADGGRLWAMGNNDFGQLGDGTGGYGAGYTATALQPLP